MYVDTEQVVNIKSSRSHKNNDNQRHALISLKELIPRDYSGSGFRDIILYRQID